MNNKPTITIGIPAYNEEQNIKILLESLFAQKQENYVLEKIIVASDGSTDDTVDIVKSINHRKIVLIEKLEREGANNAQNEMIRTFSGDIFVLLNADIIPADKLFIENLISPIIENPSVGLVAAYIIPSTPETFTEKIIAYSNTMKKDLFLDINGGDNIFMCSGVARAFSRELYKNLVWPKDVPEDAYSYVFCKKQGFKFRHASDAVVYFRVPQTLKDHIKQSQRFNAGIDSIVKFFGDEKIRQEYKIPPLLFFKKIFTHFLKRPVLISGYIALMIWIKIATRKLAYRSVWEISKTTKKI